MDQLEFNVSSLDEHRLLASKIAALAEPPVTIALNGTLGAGKTQFVRFFALGLDVPAEQVTSPTYVLLQRYSGTKPIYHFDFYRLDTPEQVWDLGIDELFEQPVVVLIEWADKFPECLPDDHLAIQLVETEAHRTARITALGPKASGLLMKLAADQPPETF